MSGRGGSRFGMTPPVPSPSDERELTAVVPARAVLTELARGFLLVRENDRERAVRFAVTFLHERADRLARAVPEASPATVPAQRMFGRAPRGAVERLDPRPPR